MKHLKTYFKDRKYARTGCEDLAGIGGVEKLASLYAKDGEQLVQACESILHQACMTTVYDHNEIQIFKTGLFALTKLLSECNEEVTRSKELEKIKTENKNKRPNY